MFRSGLFCLWPGNQRVCQSDFFLTHRERQREIGEHQGEHRFTIHPYSLFRFGWQLFMIPVLVLAALNIHYSSSMDDIDLWGGITLSAHYICFIDACLNCITGYLDEDYKIQLDIKTIFRNLYDLLTMVQIMKFFHLFPTIRYVNLSAEAISIDTPYIRILVMLLVFVFLTDLGAKCLWFATLIQRYFEWELPKDNWAEAFCHESWTLESMYFYTLERAIALITLKTTKTSANGQMDNILGLLLQIVGVFFKYIFMGQVIILFLYLNHTSCSYEDIRNMLIDHFPKRQLSLSDQKLILDHYDYRYFPEYYNESELIDIMTSRLKKGMLIEKYQTLLMKTYFFMDLPEFVTDKIMKSLYEEIYLRGEVIYDVNSVVEGLYFITKGTVYICSQDRKEDCTMNVGDFFGSWSLLHNKSRRDDKAIAVDNTEILKLPRNRFLRITRLYPGLYDKISLFDIKTGKKTNIKP